MDFICESMKPHAVLIPYPSQGHVNPMMKLAKLLHSRVFFISFIHTDFNHKRLLRSRGPHAFDGIPDGLPLSSDDDGDATQHVPFLCYSTSTTCFDPFLKLLCRLQHSASAARNVPPVTCVVSDGATTFAVEASNLLRIPSACGLVGYAQYIYLVPQRLVPLEVRLAKLAADKVLNAPCETSVLYPKEGGNLHCFTAVTPCAVLDILSPSYREDAGRKCTYYHDDPYLAFAPQLTGNRPKICDGKEEEYAWLVEIKMPSDLHMRQGEYSGPAIQT